VASRNTFTFVANIAVLCIALLLFNTISGQLLQFKVLAIIVVAIGSATSIFYIFTINEPHLSKEAKKLQKEFKMQ
jgi:Na+/melibiose symporter-like transporter